MKFYKLSSPCMFQFPRGTDTLEKANASILSVLKASGIFNKLPPDLVRLCLYQYLSEWGWQQNRRPFFRIWPGLLEAIRTLKMEDLKVADIVIEFPDDLQTICLELPIGCSPMFGNEYLNAILISKIKEPPTISKSYRNLENADGHVYLITMYITDTSKSDPLGRYVTSHIEFIISDKHQNQTLGERFSASDMFKKYAKDGKRDTNLGYFATVLSVFVGLISKTESDTTLIEPIVIKKFQEKWEATQDPDFLIQSRNRGVYGWDIGKQLPDAKQLAKMREEAIERGITAPHWRNPHFGRRWVGSGEKKQLEWRFISGSFVNKDMMFAIPQGHYDKVKTTD